MPKRHMRMMSAALAVAIPLGAAVGGAVAVPSAQAQTVSQAVRSSPVRPAEDDRTPQIGMNLYVQGNYSLADVKTFGERDLKYIADTLKLKNVALDWDYNVPSPGSNKVEDSAKTPSISDLRELTNIAKGFGLRVEYRVLFAVDGKDTRSESINPSNLGDWLSSLLSVETPALKLANQLVVKEFVVGTEMASIDSSPKWDTFFTKAARDYKGILSYASWGGRSGGGGFFNNDRMLLPVSKLGATAYPPIDLSKTATVAQLTKAWKSFLTKFTPKSVRARTSIDEMGIPALAGSYSEPWQWDNLSGTADPTVQARWYTAACDAVKAEGLRGLYYWSMPLDENPAQPYDSLVGWEGRSQSIAAIKSCAS